MTINGSISMTMNDSLGHKVDKRCKKVWDTKTGRHWNSAKECATELKVCVSAVYNTCGGKLKTCKGHELSYEENVSVMRERMANNLNKQNARMTELERKAALWDAYQKEQEEARKAEENRLNAIAKADAKIERRQRMYDRKMEECKHAYTRLMEAKQEREALGEAV